jgi:hypothetical protein
MRMEVSGRVSSGGLPGVRGRYLLWLEPLLVTGDAHWVHFSWMEESFCIRDFLMGLERRQDATLTATAIWQHAKSRIPCKGDLYHQVADVAFWRDRLEHLTKTRPVRSDAGEQ